MLYRTSTAAAGLAFLVEGCPACHSSGASASLTLHHTLIGSVTHPLVRAETGSCAIIDFTAKWCGPCECAVFAQPPPALAFNFTHTRAAGSPCSVSRCFFPQRSPSLYSVVVLQQNQAPRLTPACLLHTPCLLSPGKAIAPIYEELSQKYPQVKFLKIDIDNPDMMAVVNDHGITGVVSVAAGSEGQRVKRDGRTNQPLQHSRSAALRHSRVGRPPQPGHALIN